MSKQPNKKKPKLENYLAYGMSFGLIMGALLSLVGMLLENVFIQIAGFGIGLGLGIIVGAIIYSIENSR